MSRGCACFSFLFSVALALSFSPITANAATGPTLSVTLTEADGSTPMQDAPVGIFYAQPSEMNQAIGSTVNFAELASGTTDSTGSLTVTLDTSAIASSDLGDIGDGTPDAFDAVIYAVDPVTGEMVLTEEVLTLSGAGDTVALSANTDAANGNPIILPSSEASGVTVSTLALPSTTIAAYSYRYVPVTALNSGYGIQAVLKYATDSSTSKQTEVDFATGNGDGSWSLGHDILEQKDRQTTAPYKANGDFHEWMWASYKFAELQLGCNNLPLPPCVQQWEADYFTGNLTNSNPDCCVKDSSAIGIVPYSVPTFTPGSDNQNWFALTQSNSGWSRSSGTRVTNTASESFTLPFAGSIGSNSVTVYDSITSVTYNWISSGSCGNGLTRVIWGYNDDPVDTSRVQADCLQNSQL